MKQRGIAQGWLYLIAVIAVLSLVYGISKLWTNYIEDVDNKGYRRGKQETEARYAKRDNDALRAANAKIQELQNAARAAERKHALELAKIDKERQQEAANARKQTEVDRAAVDAGTLWLRDPGAVTSCAAAGNVGSSTKTNPAPGERNAGARGKLSREATQFLLALANEADDVAKQLAKAQQVIEQQQRTCNESGALVEAVK